MPDPAIIQSKTSITLAQQERANTLVGQITDGFLRGSETEPRDMRPFVELLTHLLPRADLFTRSVVAQKLARRSDVPRPILALILADDAAVVEPFVMHSKILSEDDVSMLIARADPILRHALLKRGGLTVKQKQTLILNITSLQSRIVEAPKPIVTPVAAAPAEAVPVAVAVAPAAAAPVAATPAQKKQQLLIDIPFEFPDAPPTEIRIVAKAETPEPILLPERITPPLVQNMVRAAVLRRPEDLAMQIAKAVDLSPIITKALLKDESAEALIAACRHLNVPEDASIQIATLLYPAVSRTREQLIKLRQTYRGFSAELAKRIVDGWRALPQNRAAQFVAAHVGTSAKPQSPAITPSQAPAIATKQASNQ